jgi:hypothetical protein
MKKNEIEYQNVIKRIDKGFGDTISRVINTVTRGKIEECGGCTSRKETLNKLIPYKGK